MATPNQPVRAASQLSFLAGMSSQLEPLLIPADGYRIGVNVLNRGGVISTRPGHEWKIAFPKPADHISNPQGFTHFKTFEGQDFLVAVVDGVVWYAKDQPFIEWYKLSQLLRADAPAVYFASCEKASKTSEDGSVEVIAPYRVLIIQDGSSAPVFWDGISSSQARDVPVGTAMAWSGNRLWVADGPRLYASDISDPLAFNETQYLGIGGSFLFPLRITALHESPDAREQLYVWTAASTHSVASNIRNRALWNTTDNFISCVSNTIGCVSHRSVTQQYGMLWWMTRDGLINFDQAQRSQLTSRVAMFDTEMAVSKSRLLHDLTQSASGVFGSFLLVSVPYCSERNRHTWVMDLGPTVTVGSDRTNEVSPTVATSVWSAVWDGTSPVAWVSGLIGGGSRCYHLSLGEDGVASVWESFTDSETDSGIPISWALETRAFTLDGFALMEPKSVDLRFSNIRGALDVAAFIAPAQHYSYQRILTHRAEADVSPLIDAVTQVGAPYVFRAEASGQYRQLRSTQPRSSLSVTCDPQTSAVPTRDHAYSFYICGLGSCVFSGLRLLYLQEDTNYDGKCLAPTGPTIRAWTDGNATDGGWDGFTFANPIYTATATHPGFSGQGVQSGSGYSQISQAAADRLATETAKAKATMRYTSLTSIFKHRLVP